MHRITILTRGPRACRGGVAYQARGPRSKGSARVANVFIGQSFGDLAHFPAGMREFERGRHDGIVLDDLRDLSFLVQHQEKLQGKYNGLVEFASTPGGQCAFARDLFAVPVVATANYSTANLNLLDKDDWLGNRGNRVFLRFPPWPWVPEEDEARLGCCLPAN